MSIKNLSDFTITGTDRDLYEYEQYIFESMGDSIFLIDNGLSFVFHSLKQLEPFKSQLPFEENLIAKACIEVMTHFKFREWINDNTKDPINKYLNDLLELETLPLYTLAKLHSQVYEDLGKLQNLIKRYEIDPFIREYLDNDEQPRNHNQKTKRDFYKRCIKAQLEIGNYLTNGIKKRAMQRAKTVPQFLKVPFYSSNEEALDRPYSFYNPFKDMEQYFNCEKINTFRHRLDHIDSAVIPNLEKLYSTDKKQFYKELANVASITEIFYSLNYYLNLLPFKHNRKSIFKEMEMLFKAEHWIGFYALALAQVEGIFSEMSDVISAKTHASLPDKVKNIRPHYDRSIYSFDYYEYYIPNQRNRFMHSGYDEDFQIKSLDLLYDIHHLLNVFMELNNPKVKLFRIHKTRNQRPFYSVAGFIEYFNLLNALNKNERAQIHDEISSFEKDIMCQGGIADSMCQEAALYIPNLLIQFNDALKRNCEIYDVKIDFEETHIKIIESLVREKKNYDALWDTLGSREAEELLDYAELLDNYIKYLPSLNVESLTTLNRIQTTYGRIMKLIKNSYDLLNSTTRPIS